MSEEKEKKETKSLGALSFLPFFVLIGAYIVVLIINGVAGTSISLPILAMFVLCTIVAFFIGRQSLSEKVDIFTKGAADSGLSMVIMIYILSGIFSTVASETGAVSSLTNLVLRFVPVAILYAGMFLITALISLAIGSSAGAGAAMVPIGVSLALTSGLNVNILLAAIFAGCMFGDNLSIVSDTTIAATKGVGAEMKDKFRENFLVVLPAAILTFIVFAIVGVRGGVGVAPELGEVNIIMILPYIWVLVTAIAGMNIMLVLTSGIAFTAIVGLCFGSFTFMGLLDQFSNGALKMANVIIMAFLVKGIIALVSANGGVSWMIEKITHAVKGPRGAQYAIGLLSALLTLVMANTTMAIITAAPLAKEIGDEYKIAPRRMASLLDIFATSAVGFLFWGGLYIYLTGLAGVGEPMQMLRHCYYFIFVFISAIIMIQVTDGTKIKTGIGARRGAKAEKSEGKE